MSVLDIKTFTGRFNIIVPPTGLEHVMPYKAVLELKDPEDELFLDIETTYDLESIDRAIHDQLQDMAEELPDGISPESHPDIRTLRIIRDALESKQNANDSLSNLGITRDIR